MPWFVTAYQADGSPVPSGEDGHIGCYGGDIFARDWRHARRIAKRRGINERVIGGPCGARSKRLYTLPSEWLRKRKARDAQVFHALCWLGHLALKSGVATPDEILGDKGLLHEFAHMRSGQPVKRAVLIAMAETLERKVPGFLPTDQSEGMS